MPTLTSAGTRRSRFGSSLDGECTPSDAALLARGSSGTDLKTALTISVPSCAFIANLSGERFLSADHDQA